MRAIVITEPGGPEVLVWQDVPDVEPGPGEVLVDVVATAVNRADLLQRQGFYPPPPGAPEWPGLECSGVISALGAGVTSHAVGDEVCCLLSGGGYAERVVVPAGQAMPLPPGVGLIDAAGLPEVACTVWSNLVMVAHLQRSEWLLVHGGGSGIGTMAIQVARALGARVAVTAGSQAKLDACAALGAEVLINYREQDFVSVLDAETGGRGVDVILDNMGAKYLERNISCLARNGRIVIIGMQGGTVTELDITTLLRRNAAVHATTLRGRPTSEKVEICQEVERHVWPWIGAGIVTPVIDRVLPITDAARAHTALEAGDATGKIVLEVRPSG
ncbi:MAG: NADPH:quinone oxidoreductase [Actinomycetales bacterium mxb001]|nr:MAG: NADPH:quinone oxidoreductase [Actinomycetales bacterium mxb001]